ncbi:MULTISPECIES: zinc-dependent metalloprotease [unclassified Arthrobacter]|uniref:zinc-dependent metalloprotease n=1 Tax=unclassified Arthrobacter TaxID=235627 RepID=UPI001492A528|nr:MULTISPECIES: zinc-dependent metalloprotease [unclassified Arthrobacter]MBE0008396.1 hydrolase [Arthrobacter sp. AET 35A]NOJ62135.1 zinc-dependent metalloprotease [Arthrobacter sp. 147(2020)]
MESNLSSTVRHPAPQLINWDLAAASAAKLTPAGPQVSAREIEAVVADLRAAADASIGYVHQITGLDAAKDLGDSDLLIVDRASWAKANTQSFQALMAPALDHLARTRKDQLTTASAALGGTVTGAQFGAILAFLSSKVLGQYDPFGPARNGTGGRLMLVAPNILAIERELNVDPADFRLWVCLHEQTHRVQFAAAPWLKDHMLAHISELTEGLLDKADGLSERLAKAAKGLTASGGSSDAGTSPARTGEHDNGILSLLQDPQDKARMSHLTAVMSLLEGHANVVMDAVDASIVPSVKTIRRRFNARGKSRGPLEKFLRRLLGLDAKMRQYSDGARFVRRVVDRVGMEGFNSVWASADHLPTEEEIHAPDKWIHRMGLRDSD